MIVRRVCAILLLPVLVVLAGCESDKTIRLSYDRPAQNPVPERISKIAVMEFGTARSSDDWGGAASDKLVAELGRLNQKYGRYKLYDRTNMAKIMAERDMKLASITDAAEAARLGQTADVDAVLFGKVTAEVQDQHLTRSKYDFATKQTILVPYTQRVCTVIVSFTMVDVSTTRTIASKSVTQTWDSDKDKIGQASKWDAFSKAMGSGSESLPGEAQLIGMMLDKCVQEFVCTVSPYEVVVEEKLEKGKARACGPGNTFAAAGDYDAAMEYYKEGLTERPDDVGTIFNLGLMYEAKADMTSAELHYRRAAAMKDNKKFIRSLSRVRGLGNAAAAAPAVSAEPEQAAKESPAGS